MHFAMTEFVNQRKSTGKPGFFPTLILFFLSGSNILGMVHPSPAVFSMFPKEQEPPPSRLVKGKEIEARLEPGQIHNYQITLEADEFIHIKLTQKGLDAIVSLYTPARQKWAEQDSHIENRGQEKLWFVTDTAGEYTVEIKAFSSRGAGDYSIILAEREEATENHRTQAEAFITSIKAKRATYPEGEAYFHEAIARWRSLGNFRQVAVTYAELGWYFNQNGKHGQAMKTFEQAISVFPEGRGCPWLSPIFREMAARAGKDKVHEIYERYLSFVENCKDPTFLADALNRYGFFLHRRNQSQPALEYLHQALEIYEHSGARDAAMAVRTRIGRIYSFLVKPPEARDQFLTTAAYWRKAENPRREGTALLEIGWSYYIEKDFERALSYYRKAIPIKQKAGDEYGVADLQDRIGTSYRELGKFTEALATYQKALQFYQSEQRDDFAVHTLSNIGQAYLKMGQVGQARDYLEQAHKILSRLDEPSAHAHASFVLAKIYRRSGDLEKAHGYLEEALNLIEDMRRRTTRRVLGQSFTDTRHEYYQHYIDLLFELHQAYPGQGYDWRSFQWSEQNRARTLREMLAFRELENLAPEIAEQERALQEEINQAENERIRLQSSGGEESRIESMNRELRRLLMRQDRLRARTPKAPEPVTEMLELDALRENMLDQDTLLLVYSLGEERGFLWEISRDAFQTHVLPARTKLEPKVRKISQLLRQSRSRRSRGALQIVSAELSRTLLGPVSPRLKDKKLVIVGSGVLSYLPFGTLPHPVYRSRLLILDHEITYLPSAAYGLELQRKLADRKPTPKTLAVFADPVFQFSDPRIPGAKDHGTASLTIASRNSSPIERSTADLSLQELPRLPNSNKEARAILGLVEEEQRFEALNFAANRKQFLAQNLQQYAYIHVASHALLHPHHQELSGIVLTQFDEEGNKVDGFLRAHELSRMPLAAELVTLSACRTAVGKDIRGEGVWGLSQIMMANGAARVLVSLWNVNDAATADLMTRFYQHILEDGMTPSLALKSARTYMIEETQWSAPYYWSGFVLQGSWR
jgi:CHAT domain-containing protein